MDAEQFEQTMKVLLDEYAKSGMTMDDFIKAKLTASGRKDAEECAAEISETLAEIDAKFASLQKTKKEGGNREEWLRQEMDDIARNHSADDMGKTLSSTIKVLNGEPDDTPDDGASYSALDAAFTIRELDDAIVKNTCSGLMREE